MQIKITLLSDFTPGSGENEPGLVDVDITTDEFGFPVIPAKRIKGCLREAARDIQDILQDEFDEKAYQDLFGVTGHSNSAVVHFDNGTIEGYPTLTKEVTELQKSQHYKRFLNREMILPQYTCERTQTAISRETETAKEDTLRTIRTIKKGLTFIAPVTISEDRPDIIELLHNSCKALRNMGISRTRGLGEVKCELLDVDQVQTAECDFKLETASSEVGSNEGLWELSYTIELLSQLAVSQKLDHPSGTDTYIPGSTILGVCAGRYIKKNQLGNFAHRDAVFRELFLSTNVKFLNAYPYDGKYVYQPAPASVVGKKDDSDLYDLAYEHDFNEVQKDIQTTKINAYLHKEGGQIYFYNPETEIVYHHSRPNDRRIGHASSGRTGNTGQFFQFEVLKAGERFKGSIIGKKCDMEIFFDLLQNKYIQIGRSKTAQYSKVKLEIESFSEYKIENDLKPVALSNSDEKPSSFKAVVKLNAPMIVSSPKTGLYIADPSLFTQEVTKRYPELKLEKQFIKTTRISGFNAKWMLPKPQYPALDAGTVFVFSAETDQINLNDLATTAFGLRTNEGFGIVTVNEYGFEGIERRKDQEKVQPEIFQPESNVMTELLKEIQVAQLKKELRSKALSKNNPNLTNSNISRLLGVLKENPTLQAFTNTMTNLSSTVKEERFKSFIKFLKDNPFEKEIYQLPITSNKNLMTEELLACIEAYKEQELFQLYFRSLFTHWKWQNRQK